MYATAPTPATPGVPSSSRLKPTTAAFSLPLAGPSKLATIWIGSVPPPSSAEASSLPTRTSLSLGNCESASVPVSSESSGLASRSRTAETPTIAVHGRPITRSVQARQKRFFSAAASEAGRRR